MLHDNRAVRAGSRIPGWIKVLGGLFAFGLIVVGVVFALGTIATSRWQRFAADLRAAGQPLTFAEIEAVRPDVPSEQNGAAVVSRNLEAISGATGERVLDDVFVFGADGRESDFFTGIVRAGIEPSRELLDRNRRLLDELAALVDRPVGRFEFAHQANPLATLLPHLAPLRTAAKLQAVDGMVRLIDNDTDGAIDTVVIRFSLAGTLQNEPTIISRLVQIAIQAQAVQGIEQILRVAELNVVQLSRLDEQVNRALAGQSMTWALWGERAFGIETLEAVATGTISLNSIQTMAGSPGAIPTFWLPTWLVRDNQLKAAQMYGCLVDAADDPDALRAAAQKMEAVAPALPLKYALIRILMPSLSRAVQLHVRITAHLRAARAALAAERFRLDAGRLPESLDELVPRYLEAVPIDPFDGGPLRLVTTADGIVVYSIGEDGVDDGGIVQRPEKPTGIPDVGVRLNKPEHRGVRFRADQSPE